MKGCDDDKTMYACAIKTHGYVSAAKKYLWTPQCVIYSTGQVANFLYIITQKL